MNTDPANPVNKDAYAAYQKAIAAGQQHQWLAFLAGWVACREFYA